MPKITVQGKTIECIQGANLRQVLLQNEIALHNGSAQFINCRGIGTCGTCAVEVEGEVAAANWRETTRRSLPPHVLAQNRRLACQVKVFGDVRITKYDGFWGQGEHRLWTPEASSILD
jgi:ferredoxin